MYATCATTGCVNAFTPIEVPGGVDSVACGPCGNPVTRLEENAPAEPKEMPTWEIE